MNNVEQKLQDLHRDGICVFDSVLDDQQILLLRQQLLTHLKDSGRQYNGGVTKNDAFNVIEGIQWVLNKTLFADIVRTVVGEDAVYVHHSDLLHNTFTGWHRDSIASADSDTEIDFWKNQDGKPYGVYKFAFYLQDHRHDNTALKYLRGSHANAEIHGVLGRIYHYFFYDTMKPAPGSLVVFDQRLFHNGVTPFWLSKILLKTIKNTRLKQLLWDWERRIRGMQDRVFIQIAFGAAGEFSNQHAIEMVSRQQQKLGTGTYKVRESLRACLLAAGIGMADTEEKIADVGETTPKVAIDEE